MNTDEARMLEMVLGGTMDTGYASVPASSAKGPTQVQHLPRTQARHHDLLRLELQRGNTRRLTFHPAGPCPIRLSTLLPVASQ